MLDRWMFLCRLGMNEGHPLDLVFANKKFNAAGLQLVDLMARPMGLSALKQKQEKAFDTLEGKLFRLKGLVDGFGLKVFP